MQITIGKMHFENLMSPVVPKLVSTNFSVYFRGNIGYKGNNRLKETKQREQTMLDF